MIQIKNNSKCAMKRKKKTKKKQTNKQTKKKYTTATHRCVREPRVRRKCAGAELHTSDAGHENQGGVDQERV
jgi:hypothetical protein